MAPHLFVQALQKLSDTNISSREASCVVLDIYMGPFCASLEKQLLFCHFIPAFKASPIPLPCHPPLSVLNQNVSGRLAYHRSGWAVYPESSCTYQ